MIEHLPCHEVDMRKKVLRFASPFDDLCTRVVEIAGNSGEIVCDEAWLNQLLENVHAQPWLGIGRTTPGPARGGIETGFLLYKGSPNGQCGSPMEPSSTRAGAPHDRVAIAGSPELMRPWILHAAHRFEERCRAQHGGTADP